MKFSTKPISKIIVIAAVVTVAFILATPVIADPISVSGTDLGSGRIWWWWF